MRPIPTTYNGTSFRSRLEADWAKTLDDRHIAWTYEPEGFEMSDGTCYSPDFYLPSIKGWLEIKGSHMLGLAKVEQFARELWTQSGIDTPLDRGAPMVLLGLDPYPSDGYAIEWEQIRLVGVRDTGKRYSVGQVRCPACNQPTVIALWQQWCRTCDATTNTDLDSQIQHDGFFDSFARPFQRTPRPAGRSKQ